MGSLVAAASATSAGSIGSRGFPFPVSTGRTSNLASLAIDATAGAATVDASYPVACLLGGTTSTLG